MRREFDVTHREITHGIDHPEDEQPFVDAVYMFSACDEECDA